MDEPNEVAPSYIDLPIWPFNYQCLKASASVVKKTHTTSYTGVNP